LYQTSGTRLPDEPRRVSSRHGRPCHAQRAVPHEIQSWIQLRYRDHRNDRADAVGSRSPLRGIVVRASRWRYLMSIGVYGGRMRLCAAKEISIRSALERHAANGANGLREGMVPILAGWRWERRARFPAICWCAAFRMRSTDASVFRRRESRCGDRHSGQLLPARRGTRGPITACERITMRNPDKNAAAR